jgi:hypothetical protein
MSDDPKPASEAEENAAREARREARAAISAIYVDTWAVLTWSGHVRFVLGESVGDDDHYRAAFVMEVEDAEGFANHLLQIVKRRKAKDSKAAIPDESEQESET